VGSSDHPHGLGLAAKERTVIVMGNIGRRRRRVEVIPESEPLAPAPQQEPAPSREPAPRTPVPSRWVRGPGPPPAAGWPR